MMWEHTLLLCNMHATTIVLVQAVKACHWLLPRCGVLSRFRAGDTGLGNRGPNHAGKAYRTCPLCSSEGITRVLIELHVVLQCRSVSYERQATGILDFASNYPCLRKPHLVQKDYLGGDYADKNVLHWRAHALNRLSNILPCHTLPSNILPSHILPSNILPW